MDIQLYICTRKGEVMREIAEILMLIGVFGLGVYYGSNRTIREFEKSIREWDLKGDKPNE